MEFQNSLHAPCLYRGKFYDHYLIVLPQVDNFAVGADNVDIIKQFSDELDDICPIVQDHATDVQH